jgi:uncharacterized membrane protein
MGNASLKPLPSTELAPIFTSPVQLQVRNEVLKIQTDEYSKANIINDVLNKDINTMRRQVEIIEDSSLRKNNTIFVLKTFMTYFVLILIPILLAVKGIINKIILYIILGILTLLLLIVIGYNTVSIMKRDKNRFMSKRFKMDPKLLSKTGKSHKCILSDEARLTPEQKQLKEYESELKTITKNLNELSEKRATLTSQQNTIVNTGKELRKTFEESYSVDTSQYFKSTDTLAKAKLTIDDIPAKQDISINVFDQVNISGNPLKKRVTRPRPNADAKCSVSSRV